MIPGLALLLAISLQQAVEQPDEAELERLREQAEQAEAQSAARTAEAEAIAAEIAALQRRLVDAGDRARMREAAADAARRRLLEIETDEARLTARLNRERASLAEVLAALQRLESANPPALAVTPQDAAEAARAAGLLADLAPRLQARAEAYRLSLDELAALRAELETRRDEATDADAALEESREEIERLIAERRDAERRARAEADALSRRAREIAADAETLDELLSEIRRFAATEPRLNPRRASPAAPTGDGAVPTPRLAPGRDAALRQAVASSQPPPTLRFADVRGELRPPVNGRIVAGAGTRRGAGERLDGVLFETGRGAQVTAPFDGVIVYAGDLPGFERGLLIRTADDYTLVLGGLALVYVSEGQSVLTGEPVGVMPARETPPTQLYFEIRRSTNQPADPEDWFGPGLRRG
jgi:septal ring factor EnvC (AmiA/AmiB activator)